MSKLGQACLLAALFASLGARAQNTCPTVTPLSGTNQVTTTSYFYDAQGNITQICDPRSTSSSQIYTSQTFDSLNRVSLVTQPLPGTTGSHPTITPTYDGLDQVTKVVDPRSLSTSYTIDGLGNLTVLNSPDSGSTTNTFDLAGNLKTSTDARSDVTTYSYDAQNRVTNIAYTSGTSTTFTYDGGASPVQFDIGHLTNITDESGSTRLYYDGFGRVVKKQQTSGASATSTQESQTVAYNYGESGSTTGKLTSVTYPSGNVVAYSYDSAGRVASITLTPVGGSAATILSSVIYNPFGQPKGWTWGNGGVYTRTFDVDGRLATYPLGETAGTVTPNALTRTAVYDGASRIMAYTHVDTSGSGTSPIALADNATFAYDNLNRTTGWVPSTTSQSYSYDLSGNRTSSTIGSSSYTDTIASTSNRLSTTTGPVPARTNAYDAAGDLTGDGTYTYTTSARGRISQTTVSSGTIAYAYNGLGQRVYKGGSTTRVSTGGNRYMYDEAGHLLGEYDIHAQLIEETIYIGDTPIALSTANGPVIVLDNSDSTVVTTGTWTVSTSDPGYMGPSYQTHVASTGTDSFIWPLPIPSSGSYHVYARWTADTNRSTAATFTVGSGAAVHENQTTNGSKWVLLGTYTLSSGTTNVKLTTDSSGYVIADAVKAVLASQDGFTAYDIYADQVNAPRVITRPSDNQMVWRWDQADPFGSVSPNQNPASLGTFVYNQRFPGQLYDSENNLFYNYFRNYDPTLGRYVQSDPIGLNGGINPYAYVGANPVRYGDPRGTGPAGAAIGAGIGGFIGGDVGAAIGIGVGGAGGTLVAPGVGTVGGGAAGGAWGYGIGAGIGATVGGFLGNQVENWVDNLAFANPFTGTPGSTSTCPGARGLKQTRRYGPDGYPDVDTDWDHDHGQGQPHVHDWTRPSDGGPPTANDRGPGRAPQPGDPGFP